MSIKRLLLSSNGKISLTKLGGWVLALAGGALTAGVCPVALIPYCKLIVAIGTGTAIAGARDAVGK